MKARDYYQDLIEAWSEWKENGDQCAYDLYDLSASFLTLIEDHITGLTAEILHQTDGYLKQSEAIKAFRRYIIHDSDIEHPAEAPEFHPLALETIAPAGRIGSLKSRRVMAIESAAFNVQARNRDRVKAGELPESALGVIQVSEVLSDISTQGFDLGVQQPQAVIGTVLSNSKWWIRIARNTFKPSIAHQGERNDRTEYDPAALIKEVQVGCQTETVSPVDTAGPIINGTQDTKH
jgi:hypothetical protein